MLSRRCFVALSSAAAVSTGLLATSASGQANVISRNARIMVGYAPSLIVDNRPGAGGRLPLEGLKGAERDGSAMTLTPGDQVALFPHVYAKLGYDALRDFAPVSTVCT